jgi:light-regulated signal transduction histidine kinase (bacteriophytochrome)
VNEILERVVGAMKGTIEERKATVKVLPVPEIWGDATAVEQIFANLLANAVNYLDPERPGEIEIGHLASPPAAVENMTVYYVKDNGVGIVEAYQPKIFAVFQRLHPKMAPGEGIGLPLVRRMVERHGGKIWVESKEHQGATFFVALPPKEHSPLTIAPRKESVRLFSRPA